MPHDEPLLYLSSDEVVLACEEVDPVAAVREALVLHAQGRVRLPNEAYLGWEPPGGGQARSISMPGMLEDELPVAGTKIINASTANPDHGLPRASGVVALFNAETARLLCIMDAGHISSLRTAAVTVLSCQHLLAANASVAAIIGAGPLARQHATLIAQRLPQISLCRIFDLRPERSAALCATLTELVGPDRIKFEAADSAQDAVQEADLVVPCTTTREGYITRAWLKPGCVAVNISLDDLCQDVLLGAERLYVDDWGLVVADEHRLLGRLARSGRMAGPGSASGPDGGGQVTGTLGQLILGACEGRTEEAQLCVVNPFGLAIEDISLAHRVFQVAKMRSMGAEMYR